jgi:hypothetical protein
LLGHAAADRCEAFAGGVAHGFERRDLFGELAAVAVERVRKHRDGALEPGGLGTHRRGGGAEPPRLAPAGPHREKVDDADQHRHDRERGDELDEVDGQQERQLIARQPQHAAQPEQRHRDREHRSQPGEAGRLRLGRVRPGERLGLPIAIVFRHIAADPIVLTRGVSVAGGAVCPHVDDHGTPVLHW